MEMKFYAGYPNYGIYEDGRILNLKSGRFLSPWITDSGYLRVELTYQGTKKKYLVHRLVASLFVHNEDKQRKTVNHIDGDKFNNHKDNLEWATDKENNAHAASIGLKAKGETHGRCKHTMSQVHFICSLISQGFSNGDIAKIVDVNPTLVTDIRRGRSWKHVSNLYT